MPTQTELVIILIAIFGIFIAEQALLDLGPKASFVIAILFALIIWFGLQWI